MNAGKIKHLAEVFSSFQGEGLYIGILQIFIRLAGCNIDCRYCDTRNLSSRQVSDDYLINKIKQLDKDMLIDSAVITGGEPLIHIGDVKIICNILKELDYKIYLETNGTKADNLKQVLKHLDYLAMDIKLPTDSGLKRPLWTEHRKFLKAAYNYFKNKDANTLFVKSVVTNDLKINELKKAVDIIENINKDIPYVIQPVTWPGEKMPKIDEDIIHQASNLAKSKLSNVRVIPQIHKIMGVQ
jgi:organic radical activating enzyme